MAGSTAPRLAFFLAGFLSASMGAFHFALPRIFHWREMLTRVPDSLEWALLGLNAMWSAATLITGLLALTIAARGWWTQPAGRWTLIALGLYWTFHTVYILLVPFPLPPSLAWLGASFVGFSATQAVLFLAALLVRPEPRGA